MPSMRRDKMVDLITTIDGMVCVWNAYFWRISFVFLIGLGIVFTLKLKGIQITHLGHNAKLALSGVNEGKGNKKLSSFEAF